MRLHAVCLLYNVCWFKNKEVKVVLKVLYINLEYKEIIGIDEVFTVSYLIESVCGRLGRETLVITSLQRRLIYLCRVFLFF